MRTAIMFLVLLTVLLVSGCLQGRQPVEIEGVEIRDYQGEPLSSINDFHENSILGPQYVDRESYTLSVTGLVGNPLEYTYDEIISNYPSQKKIVTLHCVEGWSVRIQWEGIILRELLSEARHMPEAKVIIFHAADGYTTSFPVEYIMEKDIIMAHKMNDVTLPPERGFPFQLVAESKWGYKWIKWITKIECSDDEDYKGYWESRGYSNEADLDKGF